MSAGENTAANDCSWPPGPMTFSYFAMLENGILIEGMLMSLSRCFSFSVVRYRLSGLLSTRLISWNMRKSTGSGATGHDWENASGLLIIAQAEAQPPDDRPVMYRCSGPAPPYVLSICGMISLINASAQGPVVVEFANTE